MTVVSLTDSQTERAKELLMSLKSDKIDRPEDFLDSWRDSEISVDYSASDEPFPQERTYVDPSKIAGRLSSPHWFQEGKLAKILAWMIKGEYEQERRSPPMLQKRGENYFVTDDGTHRSMAAKAVGREQMYAQVESVPDELL